METCRTTSVELSVDFLARASLSLVVIHWHNSAGVARALEVWRKSVRRLRRLRRRPRGSARSTAISAGSFAIKQPSFPTQPPHPTITPRDRVTQGLEQQPQRFHFKRRMRSCDPGVLTTDSSSELVVGPPSKDKPMVIKAVTVARSKIAFMGSGFVRNIMTLEGRTAGNSGLPLEYVQ